MTDQKYVVTVKIERVARDVVVTCLVSLENGTADGAA